MKKSCMRRRAVLITVAIALMPITSWAQPVAAPPVSKRSINVLFIGNSYTYYNNLGDILAGIAAADPGAPTIIPTLAVRGGTTLAWHLSNGPAMSLLLGARWDFVVLQEQSLLAGRMTNGKAELGDVARFHASVRELVSRIRAVKATPVLYMTWARRPDLVADRLAMTRQLADAYLSIGRELGVSVAPVGLAWAESAKRLFTLDLHQWDGSHPMPAGSYLAACVLYSTLTSRSAIGAPAVVRGRPVHPSDTDELEAVLDRGRVVPLVDLPFDTATELQRVSWDVYSASRK